MIISPHDDKHLLAIADKLDGETFALMNKFPAFSKWAGRNKLFRITGANLQYVMNEWPDADWIGGSETVKADYLERQGVADRTVEAKGMPDILPDDGDYKYKRKPMDHQRKGFLMSRDREEFGLFCQQGTGKSKIIIDNACYLYQQGKIDALIIVAWPNGVHRNWIDYELPQDMSVPYVAEYWSSNYKAKHRQEAFQKVLDEKKKLRVMSFNVEALNFENAQNLILKMLGQWRCLYAIDQSACIKNHSAQRTKFIINKTSHLAKYRRILDGAPVAEGAEELYSQFKFLNPLIIGHDTWTGFKNEFCEIGFWNDIAGYKNLPELHRRIDGYSYRVLADDCLDLPPCIYKLWPFDLSSEERRIFDDISKKGLSFFDPKTAKLAEEDEDGEIDFTGSEHLEESRAMIKNLRLQQISSGWWPAEDFRSINKGRPARLDALLTLLQQNQGKALIYSRFRADLDMIQQALGDKAVSYHGGISDDDRADAKRRFMEDDDVLYFVGQPRTAGIGHTLTAAKHVIFYSNDPSLRFREECEKRAHRKGLKHKLIVWDLSARATQDAKITRSLREKKELSRVIMQDPDNFFLKYEE